MSLRLSEAANIKTIITDKDYISIVLICVTVILLIIFGISKWSIGSAGIYFFYRGWFLYRKGEIEEKTVYKICKIVIDNYNQTKTAVAWLPISKEVIKQISSDADDKIITKCWEKLIKDGFIFNHDETKSYMYDRTKGLLL